MKVIAIDPGVSGGIAAASSVVETPKLYSMPETDEDIVVLLKQLYEPNACFMIEQVSGFIGAGHPGSRMFTFGHNAGVLRGAALALTPDVTMVRPRVWQKVLGFTGTSSSMGKTAWKNQLKERAQAYWPDLHITLKTSDAALILHYRLFCYQP
ncbi:MAG: hypothetical protein ABI162_06975 [Luteolibacter sp.]